MSIDNETRAGILSDALPYIQQYANKVVVVKYGGNAMTNEKLKQAVMSDIVLLSLCGIKIVLVHGGGPEINAMLNKIGKESKFVNGLRYTDQETIDIVQMVLCGKVNKDLVDLLYSHKGEAVGLCGLDDHMIEAEQLDPELGLVGEITKVNPKIINDVLDKGYIPVISTVAAGKDGTVYNINADTAAAYIAGALGAERLITMTDILGVMMDPKDPESVIPVIDLKDAQQLFDSGVITGGMIPKVQCCIDAIHFGVHKVTVLDGRVPHAVLMELLTDEGAGTMVVEDKFAQ